MPPVELTARLLGGAICAAGVAAALLLPGVAAGRTSVLDPGFDEGGRVALAGLDAPFRMSVSPDGSVTILNRDAVDRFLANGQPDPGFGEDGHVALEPTIEGLPFEPSSIAVDSQGRVLVFGAASDPTQSRSIGPELEPVPESWAVVLRLSADGKLDTSFGEDRGFVRTDFGLTSGLSELPTDYPTVSTLAGSVDSQDRPVLLVEVSSPYAPCSGHSGVRMVPRAIVRLTAAGSLDAGFAGGDGISPMKGSLRPLYSGLRVVNGDQPLAVVGSAGCHGSIAFHLSSEGAPLPGSGQSGVVYPELDFGAINASGSLLLRVGRPTTQVVQIAPNGHRDKQFGKDGSAPVTMPAGVHRSLRPVGVDTQGRIVLVGSFVLPPKLHGANGGKKSRGPRRGYLLIMRLHPSGKPDLSFGNHGRIAMLVGENRRVVVDQAALDPQGRLVALLSVKAGQRTVESTLLRFLLGP